jgi:hypothetical protein
MGIFKKKEPEFDDELQKLEKQLMETLRPITPRAEFIRDLGSKLAAKEFIIGSKRFMPPSLSSSLLVAGGVIGSVIMIITSIRGLVSIISVLGYLFRNVSRQNQNQKVSPA